MSGLTSVLAHGRGDFLPLFPTLSTYEQLLKVNSQREEEVWSVAVAAGLMVNSNDSGLTAGAFSGMAAAMFSALSCLGSSDVEEAKAGTDGDDNANIPREEVFRREGSIVDPNGVEDLRARVPKARDGGCVWTVEGGVRIEGARPGGIAGSDFVCAFEGTAVRPLVFHEAPHEGLRRVAER
eukprot:scaffold51558_cov29-Tisochrysis_lutea.AAC.4